MKRVTGIGGILFTSKNLPQLDDWYENHLSIQRESHGQGGLFHWREPQAAVGTKPGPKAFPAWCILAQTTKYFGASQSSFMVNYRVDNLGAPPEELKKSGIEIDPQREDFDYGRFAWTTDPDGNRIELWEPPKQKED